jgi:hypothetical protein
MHSCMSAMRSAWCALSRSLYADDASFAFSLAISSSCARTALLVRTCVHVLTSMCMHERAGIQHHAGATRVGHLLRKLLAEAIVLARRGVARRVARRVAKRPVRPSLLKKHAGHHGHATCIPSRPRAPFMLGCGSMDGCAQPMGQPIIKYTHLSKRGSPQYLTRRILVVSRAGRRAEGVVVGGLGQRICVKVVLRRVRERHVVPLFRHVPSASFASRANVCQFYAFESILNNTVTFKDAGASTLPRSADRGDVVPGRAGGGRFCGGRSFRHPAPAWPKAA